VKFNALGLMKSSPGFTMENHIKPLDFSAHAKGSVRAEVGAIAVDIGEIPVKVRIPFLKGRRLMTVIGSVGGTKIKVDPVTMSISEIGVTFEGILGRMGEGIHLHTEAKVACQTEMEASGEVCGKVGIGSIDLGECDLKLTREVVERPKASPRKKA
jgi:hypothetical protein